MFGFRADGRRLWKLDPITQFTPYIMPTRADAQNFCKQTVDYDVLAAYIKKKREEKRNISFMTIIIATYVRAVAEHPYLNRFIMNKHIYARNRVSVSFAMVRFHEDGKHETPLIKLEFSPDETIFEMSDKIEAAIVDARKPQTKNPTIDMAKYLLAVPLLPNIVVALIKLLDRFGLMPGVVYRASPFHTSMFITNMASLGLSYLYHHLYNFGTTSQFLSLGKIERVVVPGGNHSVKFKNVLPIGVVSDERVCNGSEYAQAFATMRTYLANPELLEVPPEHVNWDVDFSALNEKRRVKAAEGDENG